MDCCTGDSQGLIGVAGDFFEVKQDCRDDVPKTRFKPKVGYLDFSLIFTFPR